MYLDAAQKLSLWSIPGWTTLVGSRLQNTEGPLETFSCICCSAEIWFLCEDSQPIISHTFPSDTALNPSTIWGLSSPHTTCAQGPGRRGHFVRGSWCPAAHTATLYQQYLLVTIATEGTHMDSHLFYYYFKISIRMAYHPLTFLYMILCPLSMQTSLCPAWQAQGASVERCWQVVVCRSGLCEGTPGAAPDCTLRSTMDPLKVKYWRKDQKTPGEREGIKREKQKHGPQDERKEGGTSGLGANISLQPLKNTPSGAGGCFLKELQPLCGELTQSKLKVEDDVAAEENW